MRGKTRISGLSLLLLFLAGATVVQSCVKDPDVPVLKTRPAHEITINSAVVGGTITDDGRAPVTSRGICWSKTANPTIDSSHSEFSTDLEEFECTIEGLDPNTRYHARAYAENKAGIAYGNDIHFITETALLELTTQNISIYSVNTATAGGRITYDGGSPIIARGVCWSTSPDPDIYDPFKLSGTDTGSFVTEINNLLPGTKYFVRAWAQNSAGIVYSNQVTFNTKIADIEGNLYNTVTIGTQVWMAENLRATKYNDNTPVPNVTDNTKWINLSTPAYCWIRNDIQYKDVYGALYNWFTINTGKLCPAGWHVPTDKEFKTLELALGITTEEIDLTEWRGTDQGMQMKSSIGWTEGENGTNSSGFSALPGGYRWGATGDFNGIGMITYWWSSEYNADYAWYRRIDGTDSRVYRHATSKRGGKYVRCVKN